MSIVRGLDAKSRHAVRSQTAEKNRKVTCES